MFLRSEIPNSKAVSRTGKIWSVVILGISLASQALYRSTLKEMRIKHASLINKKIKILSLEKLFQSNWMFSIATVTIQQKCQTHLLPLGRFRLWCSLRAGSSPDHGVAPLVAALAPTWCMQWQQQLQNLLRAPGCCYHCHMPCAMPGVHSRASSGSASSIGHVAHQQ